MKKLHHCRLEELVAIGFLNKLLVVGSRKRWSKAFAEKTDLLEEIKDKTVLFECIYNIIIIEDLE